MYMGSWKINVSCGETAKIEKKQQQIKSVSYAILYYIINIYI